MARDEATERIKTIAHRMRQRARPGRATTAPPPHWTEDSEASDEQARQGDTSEEDQRHG